MCSGVCACIGPGTYTTAAQTCCSGSLQAYTDCNDPSTTCNADNGWICACQDSAGNPVCCGLQTGNVGCAPSGGMPCTVDAQCDPGLACNNGTCGG